MGMLASRDGTPYVALTVVASLLSAGMLLLVRLAPARVARVSASHATWQKASNLASMRVAGRQRAVHAGRIPRA
ncbi:hypothetical protein B7G54_34325 [Burkholderia puraquae]|nr:hypothetical protein B7G54_34325 [Burkholderia puraquae]